MTAAGDTPVDAAGRQAQGPWIGNGTVGQKANYRTHRRGYRGYWWLPGIDGAIEQGMCEHSHRTRLAAVKCGQAEAHRRNREHVRMINALDAEPAASDTPGPDTPWTGSS